MRNKIQKPKTRMAKFRKNTENDTGPEVQEETQHDACLPEKRISTGKALRQERFLSFYLACDYNVSAACRESGIGRKTFYHWIDRDPSFVEDLKQAQDEKNEVIESALYEKAKRGDVISMIFWLKAKAHWVDQPSKFQLEVSKKPKFDQDQLDAMVRGRLKDRPKYEQMLGLIPPSNN